MHKLLFASLLILGFVSLAVAQSTDPSRFELFGGYSVMRIDYEPDPIDPHTQTPIIIPFNPKQTLHGFNASATVNLAGGFGITGDFSGHFTTRRLADALGGFITTDIRVFNVLGGPQYRFRRNSRVSPFVRGLAGVANTRSSTEVPSINASEDFSSTNFALALGGGVDVRVSNRVAARVFQVDYNPVFLGRLNTLGFPKLRADNVRFSFGVVFR
jgi:opacity protein-like surface antigen